MGTQRSRARLGIGIIVFFAMIVAGVLIWTLLNEPVTTTLAFGTDYSTSSTADTYLGYLTSVWGYLLYFVLFIAGVFLLGRAVFEGRVS